MQPEKVFKFFFCKKVLVVVKNSIHPACEVVKAHKYVLYFIIIVAIFNEPIFS